MLSAKKISREVIDQALSEIDTERASSRLEKLLEAKYRSLREDPHCRLKLLRFALGRGYSYGEVNDLVNQLLK
jgi:regulatory protein